MADGTGIEWTDATWNPIRGCSRVSAGCRICYAARDAARFSGPGGPYEGLAFFDDRGRAQWTGKVVVVEDHLDDPLHWAKPRRVFVNSMSDLFHEALSDVDVARVFGVMAAAHLRGRRHVFQVLTKRPDRMARLVASPDFETAVAIEATERTDRGRLSQRPPELADVPWPLPNVWLGTSVENQDAADKRIPALLAAPAAIRFLSCEPLLGPVNLAPFGAIPEGLHWVIVGGESGRPSEKPMPMDPAWARALRDQCRASDVAFFFKQMGSVQATSTSKGGDLEEIPEDLRIREFPGATA